MKSTYCSWRRLLGATFAICALNFSVAYGQLSGTKIVGIDYPTIAAFVTDVNAVGVLPGGGGVTLVVPPGYSETAPAGGYVLTATGTAAEPIAIGSTGAPFPVITASPALTAGALNDAIFKIVGGDYITIGQLELRENPANLVTTAASNNMTEWGIALLYATTTDGAQNCQLLGNRIVLNRTYQNTFGIYANATHTTTAPTTSATAVAGGGNSGLKIYANDISNTNTGILVVGPTAAADHNDGIDIGGTSAGSGNIITDYGTTGTFSGYANVSGTVNGIVVRNSKNVNISYNQVSSSVGGVTSGTLRGIFLQACSNAPTGTYTNTFNNNSISLRSGVAAGAMYGIHTDGLNSTATSTWSISNNNFHTTSHTVVASGTVYQIFNGSTLGTMTVNGNTFSNISVNTTGTWYLISSSTSLPNYSITNNMTVGTLAKTGAGGTFYGFYNFGSPTGGTAVVSNNNFSNITLTGATVFYGIRQYTTTTQIENVQNNTISNITGGTSSMYGISHGYGAAGSQVSGNTIYNLNGAGAVYGVQIGDASAGTVDCYNNTVYNLGSTGASTVFGMNVAAATLARVYGNKIYDLTSNNAGGSAYGIALSAGTNVSLYNNVIGNLYAPISSGNDMVRGISISATTGSATYTVAYNSIYLNATSTGTNFGTTGIFHAASAIGTTANLTLKNNIVINLSTPVGTGATVAYRRSTSALNNFNAASNRNLFYAGTPGASNLIFTDGITPQQSMPGYQAMVAPRDVNSFTGEAFTYSTPGSFFISLTGSSADFLRPVAGITSLTESGGENITSPLITNDYNSVVRAGNAGYAGTGTAPDLGAYEYEGVSPAPVVTITSVVPSTATQCASTARVINATITTVSGTVTGANIVYTMNGTPQTPIAMTNTGGSNWQGTIPTATPANAVIVWSVVGTNSLGLSSSANGTPYADEPLYGLMASATANPATVCPGDDSELTAILSNPAGAPLYSVPPAVTFPTADEDLANITISEGANVILNNSTARNSLTGTIGTAAGTAGSYSDFTAFGPYALTIGTLYNFSVSSSSDVTPYNNAMAIYIDYNRNGVFTDAGEQAYTSPAMISGPHTRTGTFTVPATASPGFTRMRVINHEGLISSPTTAVSYGEYEEYMLELMPAITVQWYEGASLLGSGNPFTVSPTATTTYTAQITSSGCVFNPSPTATVTVLTPPTSPTATPSVQCGTQIPTASVASTTGLPTPTFVWYDQATGGTLLQSGVSTTYLSNVSATTTFYVSELNPGTGCESPRVALTVTVATADAIAANSTATTICIGSSVTLSASNLNPVPNQSYSYTWNGVANSGVGTGVPGASIVATPTAAGTYQYDLTGVDGGCTAIASVTVTVNPFTATLAPINVSCNGYNDGSFSVTSSSCGTGLFDFSVNTGPFGGIPTNLAPGVYSVVVRDQNFFTTDPISVTITEPSTTIGAPTTNNIIACQGDATADVTATSATNISNPQTVVLSFDLATQPTEVSGLSSFPTVAASPNIISSTTMAALPAGAVVTSATLSFPNLTATGGSWRSDVGFGLTGAAVKPYSAGIGAPGSAGTFNYTANVTPASVNVAGGLVELHYYDLYNDNAGSECTFPTGTGVATLTINYTIPVLASISWWSAASGGVMEGTGSPFNAVGTSVLPNTNTPGSYTLYAQGEYNGCSGLTRTPVTIVVNTSTSSTTTVTNCSDYTWTNGTNYTTSGVYTQILTNAQGCDSVATLNLTIIPASSSNTVVSTCSPYLWTDGNTYTVSGTYTQLLTNAAGCDSVATLDLTVNIATTSTTTVSACDSYTWTDGNSYTTSGIYMQTLTNAAGCDSVATLDLTVSYSFASTETVTNCGPYVWAADGNTYSNSGTYNLILSTSTGCDSTLTLDLTVNTVPSASVVDNLDGSYSSSSVSGNQWINCTTGAPVAGATAQTFTPTVNGLYAVVVTNASGCTDTSACFTVNNVGLDEQIQDVIAVFPNPSFDNVVVTMSMNSAMLDIMDANGRILRTKEIESGELVSLVEFPAGMYYFKINAENGTSVLRVVKQ